VKKCIFCAILLLTLPAFATIANVQSNASWTCTGTGTSIMCPGAGPPLRLFVKVGTDAADAEVLSLSRRLGH
jgi:hypothetical protein